MEERLSGAGGDLAAHVHSGVATVTLNRPQALNALTFGMLESLRDWLDRWENEAGVRMVVLRGAGPKAFCAGGDIRIAESHAQMALPEPAVGLLPAGCGTQMLPWLVGEGWAKRMILTNERVDAATALRIGLVQEVVDKGASLATATALAERVATLSPRSVEFCKSLIHNARNGIAKTEGLARERERFMDLFEYRDTAEGVNAFLEKRKPEWKND